MKNIAIVGMLGILITGCQMVPTQQVTDVKIPPHAPVTSERCVFTPEQQRNATGKELGDKIAANDQRQCNDLVERLNVEYTNEINAHAADLNKK